MTQFVVGVVVGASAAGLLMILIGPSRRVRAEKPLDRDVETKLLLGEDPDEATIPLPPSSPSDDHPRQYSPDELAELRRIGSPRRRRGK
ncbi:MAG: hypothetical protein SGJ13_06345 [Actinomycetota bacterium]|nr:hypothetical protein [Actinomycetota bacterium]